MAPKESGAGTATDSSSPDVETQAPQKPRGELYGAPVGRRVVLGLLGLGALGIATGSTIQSWLARTLATVQQHDPTGLSQALPLDNEWRYYTVTGSVPTKNASNYQLTVSGLVDRPATYTLGALQAMPQVQMTKDFQCVTGWRVPDVAWSGVLLRDVLSAAGVQPGAKAVRFTSFDGAYSESLTLDQAGRDDVIVALSMEGGPVTHAHGGPVRLYAAPMYGYKSTKWLSGIEVTDKVIEGYWEVRGYDVDAWVGRSNGRDDEPTS